MTPKQKKISSELNNPALMAKRGRRADAIGAIVLALFAIFYLTSCASPAPKWKGYELRFEEQQQ